MLIVKEVGRNLVFAAEDTPDTPVITVQPVNGKTGSRILQLWIGILTGTSKNIDADSEIMGLLATGRENKRLITGDDTDDDGQFIDRHGVPIPEGEEVRGLRTEEAEFVINSAIFWNAQGGGIPVVTEFRLGGYPKAIALFLDRNNLSTSAPTAPQSPSLSGESEALIRQAVSDATTTRSGSATRSKPRRLQPTEPEQPTEAPSDQPDPV